MDKGGKTSKYNITPFVKDIILREVAKGKKIIVYGEVNKDDLPLNLDIDYYVSDKIRGGGGILW